MMPMGALQPPAAPVTVGWTPVGKPWLLALYRADTGVLDAAGAAASDGAPVATWEDQSGLGRHALQADPTRRPSFIASDARGDGLPSLGPTSPAGTFGLLTPTLTDITRVYMLIGYGGAASFSDFVRPFSMSGDANSIFGRKGTDLIHSTSSFDSELEINGNAPSLTALPLPMSVVLARGPTQTDSVLTTARTNRDDSCWDGPVWGYLFTNGTEDGADTDRIVGWLAHEAGTNVRLIAGHPYKTNRP